MAVNVLYKSVPTLALRGMVLFPGMRFHFDVGRKSSIEAVQAAMNEEQKIFLITQKDVLVDDPSADDLYNIGVLASIKQVIKNPNEPEHLRVVVEVLVRAQLIEVLQQKPYFICNVREKKTLPVKDEMLDYKDALVNKVKDELFFYLSQTVNKGEEAYPEADKLFFTENHDEFADMVAGNVLSDYKEKQQVLEKLDLLARLDLLYSFMIKENKILEIEGTIEERTQKQMEDNHKDYYLREKIKAISSELGEGEDVLSEIQKYKQQIEKLQVSDEIKNKLLGECNKLQKMQGSSADSAVIRNYLDTALSLPFGKLTEDRLDVVRAEKILDEDHYGLIKVKERFVEMLAVRQRSEKLTGQIICLVGPPGVGKTSIVRSVAKAMGRKYVRMSLGGVSDESEIRGHRKTYIGAMPGRVVNALIQAKTFNPVILLDEIDKLGRDYKGDPSAALLEVLDPEQNSTFRDNYLEFPVDLSKVLFITTANDASSIPGPLYDRMEIIDLVSYTEQEKLHIAKNHLIKKQVKLHGLSGNNIRFTDEAVCRLINGYSKEAGVRRLEQLIASVCRKAVVEIAKTGVKRINITPETIEKMLGPVRYKKEEILKENTIGVVNGLAWTSVGGEMLQVEAVAMEGDGKIEITGSLGDVMKESAKAAYSFIRSKKDKYGISLDDFTKNNIHIHVPQGAVPKDGPSAGVTIATALLSALSGRAVKNDVAMTGEVTLTGRVLPIGGLKEKSMAAYKAGVKKVLIPKDNYGDLWEIDSVVKENVEFIPVSALDEVFSRAIVPQKDEQSSVIFSHREITLKDRRKNNEI